MVYWIFLYSQHHQSEDNKQLFNTVIHVLKGDPLFHVDLKVLSSFEGNKSSLVILLIANGLEISNAQREQHEKSLSRSELKIQDGGRVVE